MNDHCLWTGRTGRVIRRRMKTVWGLVVACGLAVVAAFGDETAASDKPITNQPVKVQVSENWHIEVVPGRSVGSSSVSRYGDVYHSIPFSRAEYEADPSYRHEATMEFLFGKMRRKVVVQSARPQNTMTINNVVSLSPTADYPKTRSKGMWRP